MDPSKQAATGGQQQGQQQQQQQQPQQQQQHQPQQQQQQQTKQEDKGLRDAIKTFGKNLLSQPLSRHKVKPTAATPTTTTTKDQCAINMLGGATLTAMAVATKDGNTPTKEEKKEDEEKEESLKFSLLKLKGPSDHQKQEWCWSIDKCLADPDGRHAFRQFLKKSEAYKDDSVKYLDFYEEVEEYRRLRQESKAKAMQISRKFLRVDSEKEIPVGKEGIEVVKKIKAGNIFEGDDIFDELVTQVKDKLSDDGLYKAFKESLLEKK